MIPLEEALKHPRYLRIPDYILNDIYAYVEIRQPVGHLLGAVLSNDLFEAFGRADINSSSAMSDIVAFIWNEVRHDCYGSPQRVRDWIHGKPIPSDLAQHCADMVQTMNKTISAQLQKP